MTSPLLHRKDHDTTDQNMSVRTYNDNKVPIRRHLCKKGDPNAVLLSPGSVPSDLSPRAIRDRLRDLEAKGETGYGIQRGYKMIAVSMPDSMAKLVTYNAQSHVVIKRPDGTFESMTKNGTGSNEKYVFVPSSRVHTELTDEQLLSGYFLMSTVIGGPPEVTAQLLRLRVHMCEFEKRRMSSCPEEMTARRTLAVRQFPGYVKWATSECRLPDSVHIDSCIAFGMPFRELTDDEMEAMLAGESASSVLKENVAISALVNPVTPWRVEKERWLPTASTMRDFLLSVVENDCNVDEGGLGVMLVAFYRKMEIEYAERLTTCEWRCKQEMNAKHCGEFK